MECPLEVLADVNSKEFKNGDPRYLLLSYSEWQVLLLFLFEVNEVVLFLLMFSDRLFTVHQSINLQTLSL